MLGSFFCSRTDRLFVSPFAFFFSVLFSSSSCAIVCAPALFAMLRPPQCRFFKGTRSLACPSEPDSRSLPLCSLLFS